MAGLVPEIVAQKKKKLEEVGSRRRERVKQWVLFQFRVYARDLAKNVLLTAGPAPVQWQQNLNFKFEPLEQESYSRKEHPETRCRQLHSHVQINTHTHSHTVVLLGAIVSESVAFLVFL